MNIHVKCKWPKQRLWDWLKMLDPPTWSVQEIHFKYKDKQFESKKNEKIYISY